MEDTVVAKLEQNSTVDNQNNWTQNASNITQMNNNDLKRENELVRIFLYIHCLFCWLAKSDSCLFSSRLRFSYHRGILCIYMFYVTRLGF